MIRAEEIHALLPHGQSMSMIDEVTQWDDSQITCISKAHLRKNNPLSDGTPSSTIILVEYAAQSAAIHAGLLQEEQLQEGLVQEGLLQESQGKTLSGSQAAYIGSLKNIEMHQQTIANSVSLISIKATIELLTSTGAIYDFSAYGDETLLIEGRLLLALPSSSPPN